MKKIIILAFATTLVMCKAKKEVSDAKFTPGDKELTAAQSKWPGTKMNELTEGRSIYTGKCTECHKNFEITKFSEKKWLHEIDDMSPKANLTKEEKEKLTKFILSYRTANATN